MTETREMTPEEQVKRQEPTAFLFFQEGVYFVNKRDEKGNVTHPTLGRASSSEEAWEQAVRTLKRMK